MESVFRISGNNGNFTLTDSGTGGIITGSGGYGVRIRNGNSTFTMTGGSITGNTGGVEVYAGTFNISGNPVITGNTKDGNDCNVYLNSGKVINVVGPLSADARIGVTTKTAPTSGIPVTFAQGSSYTPTIGDVSCFRSDNSIYYVAMNASNEAYLTVDDTDANIIVELSETQNSLPSLSENTKVVFRREFTAGKASTVCLPFDYTPGSEGNYYTFSGITKENGKYVATMTEAPPGTLAANTPYLFMPAGTEGTVPVTFFGTAGASITAGTTTSGDWTFYGTYTNLTYGTEPMTGHIYGFASKSKTVDGHDVEAGEFVHAKDGASVPPMRCYLTYKNGAQRAPMRASALGATGTDTDVPSRITVRLVSASGTVTAVGTLDTVTGEMDINTWYDMNGRLLETEPSAPGLYIHNGKTIMIKK